MATAVAGSVNGSATPDPVSGQPIGSRFHASTDGADGVITLLAGFTLECTVSAGATETYTAAAGTPISRTATVGGSVRVGDALTTVIDTVPVTYQVAADDTTATIAAGIAAAVNAATMPDPYSGLPLNSLVVAYAATGSSVVSLTTADAGAPFALSCSLTPAGAGTYTAATPSPASCTATIGGTLATGDVLVTTVNSLAVSYTAASADPATVAAGVAAAINAAVTSDPVSQLPLNEEVQAASSGDVITVTAIEPATPVTLSCSASGGPVTYTAAGPLPEMATATVAGVIPAGTILTTTVNSLPLVSMAAPGDTPASIATAIAGLVNGCRDRRPGHQPAAEHRGHRHRGRRSGHLHRHQPDDAVHAGRAHLGRRLHGGPGHAAVRRRRVRRLPGRPGADPVRSRADPVRRLQHHQRGVRADRRARSASTRARRCRWPTSAHCSGTAGSPTRSACPSLSSCCCASGHGLDPFAPLDPSPTAPAQPPVLRFIGLLNAAAGGRPDHQPGAVPDVEPGRQRHLHAAADHGDRSCPALAADFAAVEAQFALQVDPDGSIAQNLMTLVYGATASAFFFGLLNGTFTTSVGYSTPAGVSALPAQVITASTGRLSYDDLAKQLTFAGVLDAGHGHRDRPGRDGLAPDAATLSAAVGSLATASQQATGPFFATYPELLPLYTAYVASSAAAQDKRTALLASFLPVLKDKRKQEQALAAITAAAGTDPSFAAALLADPTILHADDDVTLPAVSDLMAIENQGLSASFYLGNNPAATPDQVIDAVPPSATAPRRATPGRDRRRLIAAAWRGYLTVPQDGYYDVSVAADAGAVVALSLGGVPVPLTGPRPAGCGQPGADLADRGRARADHADRELDQDHLLGQLAEPGPGLAADPGPVPVPAQPGDPARRHLRPVPQGNLTRRPTLSLTATELGYLGTATSFTVNTTARRISRPAAPSSRPRR